MVRHVVAQGVVLIVAEADDHPATAVAERLRRRHEVVRTSPLELAGACWQHTIDTDGRATTTIRTPRWQLEGTSVTAAWCNTSAIPCRRIADTEDRAYGTMELQALVASFLGSLGSRVVNAGDGQTLCGPSWGGLQWLGTAHACGLPTGSGASTRSVLVAGARVVGDLDVDACGRLRACARCQLLEVFCDDAGGVTAVSSRVQVGGAARRDATAELLATIAGAVVR